MSRCKDLHRNLDDRLVVLISLSHGEVDLSVEDWVSVVRLSTMWYMLELRARAVSRVYDLSPTRKIGLGRELKVSTWFIRGCVDFVTREQAFTDEEVLAIGSSLCIQLFRIREERWKASKGYRERMDWGVIVRDRLKDEIEDIVQDERGYQIEPKHVEKVEETSSQPVGFDAWNW